MIESAAPVRSSLRHSPWYVLAVLTLVFSVGFIDRQVLNLLVQPIKARFALSDLRVSLLQGVAFSTAYLVMSPVFGRLVDVSSRRSILLPCLVAWSLFTALGGWAGGFAMLFLARAIVGGAEAGLTPSAWSMLSDIFNERRLGRAMSIYHIGPYVGSGMALMLGGLVLRSAEGWDVSDVPLLAGRAPWQLVFVVVGALGIPCVLLLMTVREPVRRMLAGTESEVVPIAETLRTVWRERRFYGLFLIGMGCSNIPIYAFPAWLPALLTRQYGMPVATVGVQFGLVTLVTGIAGALLGPTVAGLFERRGASDHALRLAVFTNATLVALCAALFFRTSYAATLAISGLASFAYSMPTPMAGAALQIVTPNRMRGMVTSLYIVTVTIMGLGAAPTLVAFFTDRVFGDEVQVGDSLAVVCGASALIATIALRSALPAYRSLRARRLAAAAAGPAGDIFVDTVT